MSTFRTKAVATAAALALTMGGISTASANENTPTNPCTTTTTTEDDTTVNTWEDFQKVVKAAFAEGNGSMSSRAGAAAEKDKPACGTDLLGQHTNDANNPAWARIWRELTYAGIGLAAISSVIALYNFALFHGLVPDIVGAFFHK